MKRSHISKYQLFLEQEAPEILYQYRKIDEFLCDAISQSRLYAARPSTFNDPLDCNLPIKMKASPRRMLAKVMEYLDSRIIKHSTPAAVLEAAARGEFYGGQEGARSAIMKTMDQSGVICFTTCPDNAPMWAHYGDKHKGVCLGFKTRGSWLFRRAKKVDYRRKLPSVNIADDDRELLITQTYTKAFRWRYEEEWRVCESRVDPPLSQNDPRRVLSFEPSSLFRIIFGYAVDEPSRLRMVEILRGRMSEIEVCQISRTMDYGSLVIEPIGMVRSDGGYEPS